MDIENNSADERAALEKLLEQSKGSDIPVLLQAKEKAKRLVQQDLSQANLAALRSATDMLAKAESIMPSDKEGARFFKNVGEVLRYLQEESYRQIEKSKLYTDIRNGLLRKEKRNFRQKDVDRYAGSLPLSTTPDGRVRDAEDRQRRKEEAEVRIKEAQAIREETKNTIIEGQYIAREQIYQELAARAVTLNMGVKSSLRASALDLVLVVTGDQRKTDLLVRQLEGIIDGACNEYSREISFEIDLNAFDEVDEPNEPNELGNPDGQASLNK